MDIYQILESLQRVKESALVDADLLIQAIVNGRVDIYDVYAHPTNEVEKYVSGIIHKYYDEVVIDTGLHADDDLEPILDRVVDQLQKEYNVEFDETFTGYWKGTDTGTPGKKMVGADEGIEPTKINTDGSWQQEGPWVKSTGKDPRGQVTHASDEAQRTTSSLKDRLRSQWEKTKREKGLVEVGMTTGGMSGGTQNPGAQDQADPAAVAKQKTDMQKSLQGIPGIDVNKAVTDLTNPKDVSGINVAIANVLSNPATSQQAKDLLATGMKTVRPGGV